MEINEKIEKVKVELDTLSKKRKVLDEKIKKKETELENLISIEKQKKFDEFTDVVESNGFSVDEIVKAIKNNNFESLSKKENKL